MLGIVVLDHTGLRVRDPSGSMPLVPTTRVIVVVIIIMDYACYLATSTNVIRRLKEHIITK